MKFEFSSKKFFVPAFFVLLCFTQVFAKDESGFPPDYYSIIALGLLVIVIVAFTGLIYFEETKNFHSNGLSIFSRIRRLLTFHFSVRSKTGDSLDANIDIKRKSEKRKKSLYLYLIYIIVILVIIALLYFFIFSPGMEVQNSQNKGAQNTQLQKKESFNTETSRNEDDIVLLTDSSELSSGKSIFEANCIACHRKDAGGLVGPNLTDKYWLHGGGIKNVFHTISEGVPQKGMLSWKSQLKPKQIQEVASYVLSLQGSNPPNPKPPQGTIWKGDEKNTNKSNE